MCRSPAFTLVELLIALSILGVIATFTIPKVLQTQQDSKYKSIAKEAAASVAQAYQAYTTKNGYNMSTAVGNFVSYLNYVKVDSLVTTTIDARQTETTVDCGSGGYNCLRLHNGAILRYHQSISFDCTAPECSVWFSVDPDGTVTDGGSGDASPSAAGKAVQFWLYYDGKLRTAGSRLPNTCSGGICTYQPNSSFDPPWFSWN